MKIRLAERHALLTFCTISCQRATLCSLFTQKQRNAPRSANFLYDFMPARHALFTFYAKTAQRATLQQLFVRFHASAPRSTHFLSKKLLVVMSLLQVKRCFWVLFLTKRFDFIYFLLILHGNKRTLNSYSYV